MFDEDRMLVQLDMSMAKQRFSMMITKHMDEMEEKLQSMIAAQVTPEAIIGQLRRQIELQMQDKAKEMVTEAFKRYDWNPIQHDLEKTMDYAVKSLCRNMWGGA